MSAAVHTMAEQCCDGCDRPPHIERYMRARGCARITRYMGELVTSVTASPTPAKKPQNSAAPDAGSQKSPAMVEARTGARHAYRRKPDEPGRVLARELTP
jgi:hypothetical protein